MSTVAQQLTALEGIRTELFDVTREKGVDTARIPFSRLHECWEEITPYQQKTALPAEEDITLTADEGRTALGRVTVPSAAGLRAENIREGITLFGITGTMPVVQSAEVPADFRSADPNHPDPGSVEEALALYREHYGEFEGDMFLMVDNEDRRCYGFMVPERHSGQKLYANGILVPDFDPLWDRGTYPYAFLEINFYSGRDPYSWRVRLEMLSRGNGYSVVKNSADDGYRIRFSQPKYKSYELQGDAWVLVDEGNGAGTVIQVYLGGVAWSSHSYSKSGTELIAAGGEGVPCADFVIPVYDGESTVFQPIGLRELVFNGGKYGRYQKGSWWRFDFTHVRTDLQETSLRLGFDLKTCQIFSCGRALTTFGGEQIWPRSSNGEVTE